MLLSASHILATVLGRIELSGWIQLKIFTFQQKIIRFQGKKRYLPVGDI